MSSRDRSRSIPPEASDPSDEGLSRRDLLKKTAALGIAAGLGMLDGRQGTGERRRSAADAAQDRMTEFPLRRDGVVVVVRSPDAVGSRRKVNRKVVDRMVAAGLTRLTEASDVDHAWRRFFASKDVIGLKVNCLGAPTTRTHVDVALAAAEGLERAGVPRDNLIIYDRLTDELRRAGYPVNTGRGLRCFGNDHRGYDRAPTMAGEVASCYTRIVSQDCTALLNLPLLKDHDVAGVSISLKNHFGSINNPNKLHLYNCCPYAADVNLAPMIRRKQRLIICDALEVIYEGGPTYRPGTADNYGALLVSTDPVALDRVGWDIIEGLRAEAGLKPLQAVGREPRHIVVGGDAQHRLGVADPARIRRIEVSVS